MSVHLRALGVKRYRGIGNEMQLIHDFKKLNIFLGANNSGKSAVLELISKRLSNFGDKPGQRWVYTSTDKYDHGIEGDPEIWLGVLKQDILRGSEGAENKVLLKFLDLIALEEVIWFKINPSNDQYRMDELVLIYDQGKNWEYLLDTKATYDFMRFAEPGTSGGSFRNAWFPALVNWIVRTAAIRIPTAHLIPAKRQIARRSNDTEDYSGNGLIDRLAEVQSPDYDRVRDRDIFNKIVSFLREVTGHKDAKIDIPHNRAHVLVHINGRVLPLYSLGTGIHEVVLIAALCTLTQDSIICLEEPEIHIHPLLQKKLIKYLADKTSNQYFIATHSASLIDTNGAALFHVSHNDRQTYIRSVTTNSAKFDICKDLGYRASDLIQSNLVIWVEGPSDRMYIKHWIRALRKDLHEGIHYSIMFYGGRLLNHLSATDNEITDFINLRMLNRNLVVVMDSDKTSDTDAINSTKKRVKEDIESFGGYCWVTKGTEIENYVECKAMHSALRELYPGKFVSARDYGQYEPALAYYTRTESLSDVLIEGSDKIKIAKIICSHAANLEVLNLKEEIVHLCDAIDKANNT